MPTANVLATAAALHDFTVAQMTAYCEADEQAVVEALTSAGGLVERVRPERTDGAEREATEPGSQRWRVVDPCGLRDVIARARAATAPRPARGTRTVADDLPLVRLLRAEETLFKCATERSAEERRLMAATAMDYLRQVVAAEEQRHDWWAVDLSGVHPTGSRVRIDAVLATMTESEAVGELVPGDCLIDTADEICGLVSGVDQTRVEKLVGRFIELAGALSRRSTARSGGCDAPVRLMSAVGWRRVRAQVVPNVQRASEQVVSLLRWMDDRPGSSGGRSPELFRLLEHLPDGRNRIEVFSDLLTVVPRQYRLQRGDELVPGVLVQAVADSRAASHLERCASALETGLVQAPYVSDSALVGLVNQVFLDLAAEGAELDHGVLPRSVAARRELLSLFDVHAGTAGYEG